MFNCKMWQTNYYCGFFINIFDDGINVSVQFVNGRRLKWTKKIPFLLIGRDFEVNDRQPKVISTNRTPFTVVRKILSKTKSSNSVIAQGVCLVCGECERALFYSVPKAQNDRAASVRMCGNGLKKCCFFIRTINYINGKWIYSCLYSGSTAVAFGTCQLLFQLIFRQIWHSFGRCPQINERKSVCKRTNERNGYLEIQCCLKRERSMSRIMTYVYTSTLSNQRGCEHGPSKYIHIRCCWCRCRRRCHLHPFSLITRDHIVNITSIG